MNDSRAIEVARRLLSYTKDKKVSWVAIDPEAGIYRFALGNSKVEIGPEDNDGQPPYAMWIFNVENNVVDYVDGGILSEKDYAIIEELATVVREQHLRTNETYDDLFRTLDDLPPF